MTVYILTPCRWYKIMFEIESWQQLWYNKMTLLAAILVIAYTGTSGWHVTDSVPTEQKPTHFVQLFCVLTTIVLTTMWKAKWYHWSHWNVAVTLIAWQRYLARANKVVLLYSVVTKTNAVTEKLCASVFQKKSQTHVLIRVTLSKKITIAF